MLWGTVAAVALILDHLGPPCHLPRVAICAVPWNCEQLLFWDLHQHQRLRTIHTQSSVLYRVSTLLSQLISTQTYVKQIPKILPSITLFYQKTTAAFLPLWPSKILMSSCTFAEFIKSCGQEATLAVRNGGETRKILRATHGSFRYELDVAQTSISDVWYAMVFDWWLCS